MPICVAAIPLTLSRASLFHGRGQTSLFVDDFIAARESTEKEKNDSFYKKKVFWHFFSFLYLELSPSLLRTFSPSVWKFHKLSPSTDSRISLLSRYISKTSSSRALFPLLVLSSYFFILHLLSLYFPLFFAQHSPLSFSLSLFNSITRFEARTQRFLVKTIRGYPRFYS